MKLDIYLKYLKTKDIKGKDLAESLKYDPSYVSRVFNGKDTFTKEFEKALLLFLGPYIKKDLKEILNINQEYDNMILEEGAKILIMIFEKQRNKE